MLVASAIDWAPASVERGAPLRLGPLVGADASAPAAPWHFAGLPAQSKPRTRFEVVALDGERVLRVESDRSYGNLVHPLAVSSDVAHLLAWRWRVDEPLPQADLRHRRTEDMPVRVCASFDLPLSAVPFIERQILRAARVHSDEVLPAAAVCYVWDNRLSPGTALESPFTRRIRYIVLRGPGSPVHAWVAERRDVRADFLALFGDESRTMPTLEGVVVGGDADNTQGHALAFVADLTLD